MKKVFLISIFIFAAALLLNLVVLPTKAQNGERKIVVFQENFVNQAAQDELVTRTGGVKVKSLPLLNAAVLVSDRASQKVLQASGKVKRIDPDVVVEALEKVSAKGKTAPAQPAQVLPWGIDQIDAELAFSTNPGTAVRIGIIDTGIDLNHPDLAANIKGNVNTINPLKTGEDDNGHGTHVAGIAGAVNNTIGVVGAGPQIHLYAIKVLNRNGSGFLSDVIEGIGWAITNNMQVINMSLGTSSDIQSFHDAIIAARNAGIVQVAAAGNNSGSVIFPAAYPEVIAVSATDQTDTIASFSSRGLEVDLAAPGVSIYSTYKGDWYATLSGTSMASPHVAGSAALALKTSPGVYDTNGNGVWDPVEVQAKLEATATNLGVAGKDSLYGAGLVNAFAASQ
ncbi:MAG: S8 family peptidase [Candidatus Portnoybacteria bacterium]|nr:S8 family peptidase [Candidatus Portnoybacteria bacterium]